MELAETIQLAASVGAGTIVAMARRASEKAEPPEKGKTLRDYLGTENKPPKK
ncbi:MAG: hypothetical protein ACPLQO_10375 [Desulfotomaculales bacterium]